ncbi:MAG: WecB/TagA/CpsF family glycosyltransferase [Glaciimonas sp.]|nr:WecB/TagA/CpsF family glycosyltransferase [Glaciimonas sp.]
MQSLLPRDRSMVRNSQPILGATVDALSWDQAIRQIATWSAARESRYICLCNVHSVVTASQDPEFRTAIQEADLCAPDGAPVAWALRQLGFPSQQRINGPDLMWKYLHEASRLGQKVFFYGSTDATLARLRIILAVQFPDLIVVGTYSPPFRPLTPKEDRKEIDKINRSGASTIFVSLGCPKQEKWMFAHRSQIHAVLIGVGAAFDYHAGTIKRAPLWMQRHGLEWLYRLGAEPRRLFRRYAITNTLFIIGFSKQIMLRALGKFRSRV